MRPSVEQFRVAGEAGFSAVGIRQGDGQGQALLIQTLLQDVLHATIRAGLVIQGSGAGRLQSSFAVTTAELPQALNGTQVVEDAVCKETVDQFQAALTDLFRLRETPLRVTHQIGLGLRRQVVLHRAPCAGFVHSGVAGHELLFVEDLHRLFGGPQPERLVHQRERRGIERFFELDMAVTVQLHRRPGCQLGRDVR